MAYSVDWIAKVFTIPQSDLTFLDGSNYLLNVTDVHEELRRLEWSLLDGLWAQQIAKFYETVTLSGIPKSPSLEIINGYTFNFTGSNYNVVVDGFDTNLFDVYLPANGVSMLAINSVGRQTITTGSGLTTEESEQLSSVDSKTDLIAFLGGVVIDETNGYTGTGLNVNGDQIGTRIAPSNNLTDTKIIADNFGFNKIYVANNIASANADFSIGYTFIGDTLFSIMNIHDDAVLTNCSFLNITTIGQLDGFNTLKESLVLGARNVGGLIIRSEMRGLFTVSGALISASCYTSSSLEFDMLTGGQLSITDFHGSMVVDNILANNHAVEISGGRIEIGAGCIDGTLTISGSPYEIIDNSTGTTIIDLTGDTKTRATNTVTAQDSIRIEDMWQFMGEDQANPVIRTGDEITEEILTVDGKVLTITPDDITRT